MAGNDDISIAEWPRNVWLGVTVCNRDELWKADELLKIPAAYHFVSFEPLLGDLGNIPNLDPLDLVILGGESGPGARPLHPDWARSVRDQCKEAGVPFHFKQWGEWADLTDRTEQSGTRQVQVIGPRGELFGAGGGRYGTVEEDWEQRGGAWMVRVGAKKAGCLLDGKEGA